MNLPYFLTLLAGALCVTGLFCCLLKSRGMKMRCAAVSLPLSAVCGFVCAKVLYFLLMIGREWLYYGLSGLLRFGEDQFSFLGGCLGAVIGVILAAKITGQPVARALDAFAPCGALGVAFARAAEHFLPEINTSSFEVENPTLHFFPLAVSNPYDQWYVALYFLGALAALAVCVLFLARKKELSVPGVRFCRVAFYLCLPQIFLESLRGDSMFWGFVRAEQVLCGVILFLVLLRHCVTARKDGLLSAYWPLVVCLLCIGVMVFVEFNLDKQFIPMETAANYGIMWLALLIIAACEVFAVRRRLRYVK